MHLHGHARKMRQTRAPCTHVDIQAALRADPLHDPQTDKRISPRCTPDSAQAGTESQPSARKSRLTVAARKRRKRVEELGRFDRPLLLVVVAAGRTGRQMLTLVVEEEPRAPGPLPQHRERAWRQLSWHSCAVKGTAAAFAFFQARDRQGDRGAQRQTVSSIARPN